MRTRRFSDNLTNLQINIFTNHMSEKGYDSFCWKHSFCFWSKVWIYCIKFVKPPRNYERCSSSIQELTVSFDYVQHISCNWSLSIPPKKRKSKISDVFRGYRKRPVAWNGLRIKVASFFLDYFLQQKFLSFSLFTSLFNNWAGKHVSETYKLSLRF